MGLELSFEGLDLGGLLVQGKEWFEHKSGHEQVS